MVLILNEQSIWPYSSILTDSLDIDYPFLIACVQPPPPITKNRLWGRGRLHTGQSQRDDPFLALVWKQPITKFPCPAFLMIAKDCTERLSLLLPSPYASLFRAAIWVSGHVVRVSFFLRYATERPWTRMRGNVYRGVRDKQTIVVYRQCVLQTVTYLCVLFH